MAKHDSEHTSARESKAPAFGLHDCPTYCHDPAEPLWLIPQISFWQGFLQSLLLTGKARDLRKGRAETQWINRRMHECTRWSPTATSSLDRQEERGWMKERWSSQHTGTIRHTTMATWASDVLMATGSTAKAKMEEWLISLGDLWRMSCERDLPGRPGRKSMLRRWMAQRPDICFSHWG